MVIRMKGVKRVVSKGKIYFYHRKTMTRLPGEPGTTAFMDALAKAAAARGRPGAKEPGSWGELAEAYRASPEFGRLAPRTKSDYEKVFNYLAPIDRMPLEEMDQPFLYAARDKAHGKKGRRFGNYLVDVTRIVFNWGKRRRLASGNPASDVEKIRRPKNAPIVNRPWTDWEYAAVMAAAGPELRVSIAIGAHVGLREGDMLKVTWASYDGTAFEIRQGKTGESLWVPATGDLRAVLDEAKKRRTSPLIVTNTRGGAYTQSGFQSRFFGLLLKLKKAGKIDPGLSYHGLRHWVGKNLAEVGCDAKTIAAVLGHSTTTMAEHYSRTADRRHLAAAAIRKIERTKSVGKRKTGRKTDDREIG
jgi:integrase